MGGREEQVGVRLSEEERGQLQRAADLEQRALADWIRVTALVQAAKQIGGEAPVRLPDPEDAANLAMLRQIEASDPLLPGALLGLGRASTTRPRLARALKELAADALGDGHSGIAPQSRKGPRLGRGKG